MTRISLKSECICSKLKWYFPFPLLHCRQPGLSQRLTELAQRLDFTGAVEGEESEPAAKRATQKWPWEFTHSKLK